MAKGFLETLGAAYDDHSLTDVIPVRRPKSRKPGAQRSGRKAVAEKPVTPEPADPKDRQHSASRRKSFLGLLHDTFDQDNVEELIDLPLDLGGNKRSSTASNSRIIVFIDQDIAEKAKALAKKRKTELRHVVEEALKQYLNG